MAVAVTIPQVGESVREAVLVEWFKPDGGLVAKDEPLCVIETDKVTLEVAAEVDGVLSIQVKAGETVAVGTVLATIEPSAQTREPPPQTREPSAQAKEPSENKTGSTEEKPAAPPEKSPQSPEVPQETPTELRRDAPVPVPPKNP